MRTQSLTGLLLALLYVAPCSARADKLWSYDELQKTAGLIIIAKPLQSEPTAAKLDGYETATGVNTTFEVLSTLKGTPDGKPVIVLHHFSLPHGGANLVNCPSLVSFPTGDNAATYLLFLKKNPDGTYDPVAGQVDPVNSCFTLSKTPPASAAADDAATHPDNPLTKQISDILHECQKLKPGMTRAELLKTFTTEGGLSTAEHRTYVLRRCPYIKIDVDFTLSIRTRNVHAEDPTDTISKVSKPYLAWSVID